MKALLRRRYLPSELSRKMGLAPSTVVEHLKVLEGAELVQREETGHKWIYYSLTGKGMEIAGPPSVQAIPLRILLSLVVGGGVVLSGLARFFAPQQLMYAAQSGDVAKTAPQLAEQAERFTGAAQAIQPAPDVITPILLIVGVVLIVLGLIGVYFNRKK